MVLACALMIVVCVMWFFRGRWPLKIMSLGYIFLGISAAIYYVVPLILSTFAWGAVGAESGNYTSNFAATDLSSWYETMWVLPKHLMALLFGTGEVVRTSDLGYVNLIFMIGFVGTLLVVSIYAYMLFAAKILHKSVRRGRVGLDGDGKILLFLLIIILLGFYVINVKNLYFLTRGYHERIVILFFFILGLRDVTRYRAQGPVESEPTMGHVMEKA